MYFRAFIYIYDRLPDIGLAVRVFANGLGDLGSIQKMILDASLLNTQHYKVRIKGKVEQSREGVAPSPTPWYSSYRKGSLQVTLDYGRQLTIYIYIYQLIGLVGRVSTNSLGDCGSIPGQVIPKTLRMLLDTSLLNTQHYKVHIKGKVEQPRERSSALLYTSV